MPRPIKNVTDIEIDEISLVDKAANQHAMVTIAKRAPEEDQMPDLYDESGAVVDQEALEHGDIVFDDDGNAYEFVEEEEDEQIEDREPEPVGKSAFFDTQPSNGGFAASVMEELSKAYSDEDRDRVLSKAFAQVEELEKRQAQFVEIAKAERDLRLTREYVSKAAEYNLPIAPEELGPVLYRMAESMSYDDCAVIAKCLETAGAILYEEVGFTGGGDNADIMDQVSAIASERVEVGKAFGSTDIVGVLDENPQAYDEYLSAQRGRFQ
jgi:hypothetical protein